MSIVAPKKIIYLTYYMTMCILITMNIYIRLDLEEHLRKEESMSGLINKLLFEYYDKLGRNIQRPVPEVKPKKEIEYMK